jgi:hypothetical protein
MCVAISILLTKYDWSWEKREVSVKVGRITWNERVGFDLALGLHNLEDKKCNAWIEERLF